MKSLLKLAAAAVATIAICSPASAVVVGSADTANGIPFGSYLGGYYYQQVYAASSLQGIADIHDISFYNTLYPSGSAKSGNFNIYLPYLPTSVGIAAFDTNTSVSWFDSAAVLVYSGVAGAITSGQLEFDLTGAFHYDSSKGKQPIDDSGVGSHI